MHPNHPQKPQRKFLNSIIVMIFLDSYHTRTSLVMTKIIWVSITVFSCSSWRWLWEMHLNRLKKTMQASKLVKWHLNNSDQSKFVYDAITSGWSAVALQHKIKVNQFERVTSSNINEVIRPVLTFLFIYLFIFFHDKILHALKALKSTKSTKKHKNTTKQK